MNLVKWLRKNNTKIMAVVVIVLMIGFIGGSSLSYLLRGGNISNKTVAYYGNNIKIKRYDILAAQQELDILKTLQAGNILKAIQIPFYKTPDLHALALGELLFSEQKPSQEVISYIEEATSRYQYRISNKLIDDLYTHTVPNYYFWFILTREAENAGFKVPNDIARTLLNQAISKLMGQSYTSFIGNMMRTNVISEDQVLATFSKLLALLRYSHVVCSGEDVTIQQLRHIAASQEEGLDIEFVKFDSEKFAKNQEEPSEGQIAEQFDKYKQYFPGSVTDENPYGFGYKLFPRVRLEYIVIKLDDIAEIVNKPTSDELEEFYNSNKEREFTEKVPSNPNDPNSEKVERTKLFSEVADDISEHLLQEKINNKASSIIQEARTLADGSLQDINDADLMKLSIEERKNKAGKYEDIAEKLNLNYKINIYAGKTGELSAEDMQTNKLLSKLYMQSYVGQLRLARVVFAVDKLDIDELGPYEIIKPRIYLSLGPVKDTSGKIIAIVRVIDVFKTSVPEDINLEYSLKSINIDPNQENKEEKIFSVKENVVKDLKRLAAMETAKNKAQEFLELTAKEDESWETAVNKFNELYSQTKKEDVNNPNLSQAEQAQDVNEAPFELRNLTSLRRLSKETLDTIALQNQSNPALEGIKNLYHKEALFLDKLFSLVPQDSNSTEFEPEIIEFKPDLSYYVIKNISITTLWKEDYEKTKAISSYTEDHVESQSLALVQFNPANILKRMNFRFAEDEEEGKNTEPNEAEE